MTLIRVGPVVINFNLVTDILQGDPDGPPPEAVIVNFSSGRQLTFTGEDAEAIREYLGRTTKPARLPRTDHSFE